MSTEIKYEEVRGLKVGRYVVVDNEPCKVISLTHSKPGKHGEAKVRIEAIGLFDDRKRATIKPAGHKIEVPTVDKNTAQVLNVLGEKVQLMDMQTYETFELPKPPDMDLSQNMEVMYMDAMGKRKIIPK